jgi:hypothetical protein
MGTSTTERRVGVHRLGAQGVARPSEEAPAAVVARLGAVQAQDAAATRWAVGVRLAGRGARDEDVEGALADGSIVRTHAMRNTWQLMARGDVRWMLGLLAPRLLAACAGRFRELDLDAAAFRRSDAALERALRERVSLTRAEAAEVFARARVAPDGLRLTYLLHHAELRLLVCNGPRRGKQPTHALVDDRIRDTRTPFTGGDAVAELARRYFLTRGPASLADFVWWSGLTTRDARAGLEAVQRQLVAEVVGGRTLWRAADRQPPAHASSVFLLPPFDEYFVAYTHRAEVIDARHAKLFNAGGGILPACVVVGGRAAGTWKRTFTRDGVSIVIAPFAPLAQSARKAAERAASRYAAFLGQEARVRFTGAGGARTS